jgi:hypothetical protein
VRRCEDEPLRAFVAVLSKPNRRPFLHSFFVPLYQSRSGIPRISQVKKTLGVFKSFDDIVDHWCYAWNTLIDQPWNFMCIARHDWATVGYPM